VSLIINALRIKGREDPASIGSGSDFAGKPLLDGFFPYVSGSRSRTRSRFLNVLLLSTAVVALLGVGIWFAIPTLNRAFELGRASSLKATPPRAVSPSPQISLESSAPPASHSLPPVSVATAPVPDSPARSVSGQHSSVGSGGSGVRASVHRQSSSPTAGLSHSRADAAPKLPLKALADASPVVRSVDPTSSLRDTAVVQSNQAMAPLPVPARSAPTIRRNYEVEATSLFNSGDYEGARAKFVLATRTAPTASAWTNYGVTLERLGEMGSAAAAYRSAFGIDPNYLPAWLYLGRLYARKGDLDKATASFQRALQIEPENADVNTELAQLEWNSHNAVETRRFARVATASDSTNFRAHWFLAIASDALNDAPTARSEFSAYLRMVDPAGRENVDAVGWARERLQVLRGGR
jgi:Tfp pilus assembly protein PilF